MTDTKTNKMLVNVVLDKSGSMNDGRERTISGYNEYINGLRQDTASEYSVSLIQFDSGGSKNEPMLTISYLSKPLAEVPLMVSADYVPRGSTPLYDAIGECVRRAEVIKGDRAITTVIITDGHENASKEFDQAAVKALIKAKEADAWTFVFIGADIDSYAVSGALGMSAGNTSNYTKGLEHNLYGVSASATSLRAHQNASVGVERSSMMAFFSNEQKSSMGDETVNGSGATIPADNTIHSVNQGLGGQQAATPVFPGKTPVGSTKPKPRDWVESTSK